MGIETSIFSTKNLQFLVQTALFVPKRRFFVVYFVQTEEIGGQDRPMPYFRHHSGHRLPPGETQRGTHAVNW